MVIILSLCFFSRAVISLSLFMQYFPITQIHVDLHVSLSQSARMTLVALYQSLHVEGSYEQHCNYDAVFF